MTIFIITLEIYKSINKQTNAQTRQVSTFKYIESYSVNTYRTLYLFGIRAGNFISDLLGLHYNTAFHSIHTYTNIYVCACMVIFRRTNSVFHLQQYSQCTLEFEPVYVKFLSAFCNTYFSSLSHILYLIWYVCIYACTDDQCF